MCKTYQTLGQLRQSLESSRIANQVRLEHWAILEQVHFQLGLALADQVQFVHV